MKLALIPPFDRINDLHLTDYQMALPAPTEVEMSPVGLTGKGYMEAYRQAAARGDYVILDNGIAEGKAWEFDKLLDLATYIQASEVVLPDVIGDAGRTFSVAEKAWSGAPEQFNYMYVAQGKSVQEAFAFVATALAKTDIRTIGIPRHFVETIRFDARVQLVDQLIQFRHSVGEVFDIHLLGTNPTWMQEVKFIERTFPDQVRGVDTSAPYAYAHFHVPLTSDSACRRYDNYFTRPFYYAADARSEIFRLKGWCDSK